MPKTDKTIRETLIGSLATAKSPRDVLQVVRAAHPDAKKKDVIRAAFACMIELSDREPFTAKQLQDFAISSRANDAE